LFSDSDFEVGDLKIVQKSILQSVDYTSVNEKLLQSWRYKTLAVIKRHNLN